MTAELESFLPSIEVARGLQLGIPEREPDQVRRMAGLIVLAQAVRRDTWDEVVSARQASGAAMTGYPDPPSDYVSRVFSAMLGPARNDPGSVVMRHCTDRIVTLEEMYAPTLPIVGQVETALEQLAEPGKTPPEVLRCHDLRPRRSGAAYRDGGALEQADFHGFGFGDALDRGADAVSRLGVRGTVFLLQVRAYAWPFLWLRYDSGEGGGEPRDLLLAPDREGALHLIEPAQRES